MLELPVDLFNNNLAFPIIPRDELQKLQSNLACAFAPGQFRRPQAHQNGFQGAYFTGDSVFDNIDRIPEEAIDNLDRGRRSRSAFLGAWVS
jgi:hypothetical protein